MPKRTLKVLRKVVVKRHPITLTPTKAVSVILATVLGQVTQSPSVKIAISAFCEGRGLEGEWALEIRGARLVPVEPIHEGVVTPD